MAIPVNRTAEPAGLGVSAAVLSFDEGWMVCGRFIGDMYLRVWLSSVVEEFIKHTQVLLM